MTVDSRIIFFPYSNNNLRSTIYNILKLFDRAKHFLLTKKKKLNRIKNAMYFQLGT